MIHRTEPYTIIAEQRSLIEDLAKSNAGYIRNFERLKLNREEVSIDQESVPADWSNSMPTPKTLTARGPASTLTVDAPVQRESSADAKGLDRGPYKGSDIPYFSSSDRLGWLLQQYDNLMRTLLREVSAPDYEIAEESRSRIKADIVLTQRREMNTLSRGCWPGIPSFADPRTMRMQQSGQRVREYSASKVDVDQVSAPVRPVSTQPFSAIHCISPSDANSPSFEMGASFIAPLSNRVDEIHYGPQPRTLEPQSWTPNNDDLRPQSYIRQSEASPRLPLPVSYSYTVPPAQASSFHAEAPSFRAEARSLEKYDRKLLKAGFGQSDRLQPTQSESEGDVTPWQQRGRDDCRNEYNDDQVATSSSVGYGDSNEGVTYDCRSVPQPPLSDDPHRYGEFTGGAGSEAPPALVFCSEQTSSRPMRKAASHDASLNLEVLLGGQVPQWGPSLHPEVPLEGQVPQWENDSSNPRSSKRLRISKVEASGGPATANEDPPAHQGGAGDVIEIANDCQGSRTHTVTKNYIGCSMARHSRSLPRKSSVMRKRRKSLVPKESLERIFKDDGSEDWAEHIVDKLLATWTTLPLHTSQINPPHGTLAEAAY